MALCTVSRVKLRIRFTGASGNLQPAAERPAAGGGVELIYSNGIFYVVNTECNSVILQIQRIPKIGGIF